MSSPRRWGVYISGPGIIGRLMMRGEGGKPLLFEAKWLAEEDARKIQAERPYHHVTALPYAAGDENRGAYAADPG